MRGKDLHGQEGRARGRRESLKRETWVSIKGRFCPRNKKAYVPLGAGGEEYAELVVTGFDGGCTKAEGGGGCVGCGAVFG